jgi:DUF4097 and DUF4098 domain-containing protein YvlB
MCAKRISSLMFVSMLLAAVQAFGKIEGDLKRSFSVGKGGKLSLETDLGSIDVKTHEGDQVGIEIDFKSSNSRKLKSFYDDFAVEFRQDGKDVYVKAEYTRDRWNFWDSIGKDIQVRFHVTVPRQYHLALSTAGGSISVSELEGQVEANTSGGSLDFGAIRGPITGRTSGGSVSVVSCDGRVDVKTSGGSIRLGKVKGNVYARTSGGGVHVDEVKGSIDAATSGGSVSAMIGEQPVEDCKLETSGGGITVTLAENVKFDVDAKTSGGGIKTDHPVSLQGEISSSVLRGKVNGGGPLIYLRTSGGSIYLKKNE